MDNDEMTQAVGSDNFDKWCKEVVKHFQLHYDADATVTDDLIKISYKDKLDVSGNPKAIMICKYTEKTNLWFINYDSSFIDLTPYEILSFHNTKEKKNANK